MDEAANISVVDYTEQMSSIIERLDASVEYFELIQYSIASVYTAQLFFVGATVSIFVLYFLYKAIKQLF